MKKIFLSLALMIGIFSTSFAQAPKDGDKNRDRDARITKELNLDATQQEKIQALNKDFRAKMKELRENESLTREAKASKRKELSEQHKTNVNTILSADQQARWAEFQKNKPNRNGKKDRKVIGQNKDFKRKSIADVRVGLDKLDLTDAQKEQMKALREEFKDKKGKEFAEQHKARMNEILTPEQQKKVREKRVAVNKEFRRRDKPMVAKAPRVKMDAASREKMNSLRKNYQQERESIQKSGLSSSEQESKLNNLRSEYRQERQQLMKESRPAKFGNNG